MDEVLKMYGERNTGTNIVERVLAESLGVRPFRGSPAYRWIRLFGLGNRSISNFFRLTGRYNLGWKHCAPDLNRVSTRGCFVVAMVKNPYSWLLSLNRRPYHNRPAKFLEFGEFIRSPWPVLDCEGLEGPQPSPMALWNEKNRAYDAMCSANDKAILVRYEDFLADAGSIVRACATTMGIAEHVEFDLTMLSQGAKVRDRAKSVDDYKDYYLGERWKSKLTVEHIQQINSALDLNLVQRLGYEIL